MIWLIKKISGIVGTGARAFVALVGITGISLAIANYTMTQGAGTTFGSIVVGGTVHYAQQLICDYVTPSQCVNVSAAGRMSVDGSGVTQPISAASLPLPTGAAASAAQGATTATPATVPTTTAAETEISLLKAITNLGATPLNNASVAINVSTATTTQLVALSGATLIYVTSYDVIAGGTGNATFVYGTGTNCGTGTTSLTGPYPLTAQAGIAKGAGIGTVLRVPSGNALCITTSAAVQYSGSLSYQQF